MAGKDDDPPQLEVCEGLGTQEDEGDGEENSEEDEEEDDEKPPPMNDSSASEDEGMDPPLSKVYNTRGPDGKWTKTRKVPENLGRSKMPKQAPAPTLNKPIGTSKPGSKSEAEPPIWTQWSKHRSGLTEVDRLGVMELKTWEAFEVDGAIPPPFISWYENQVKGNRQVAQAGKVPRLPSGFPEFCHWVAEGHHKLSAVPLKPGFQAMAEERVRKVRAAQAAQAAQGEDNVSKAGGSKGGVADSSRMRRRERRMGRKGGGAAMNETIQERMQVALAGLESITNGDPGDGTNVLNSATRRAFNAGMRAEEELRKKMGSAGPVEDGGDDLDINLDFDLSTSARSLLEGITRARTYRQRADRNFALLEAELERCFLRVTRIETQYQALVAETSGRESSPESALARAVPLIDAANDSLNNKFPLKALRYLTNAIKFLEVHVSKPPRGEESKELARARLALGLALCNRSVANLRLGNAHSAKEDAVSAADLWPHKTSRGHHDRCLTYLNREGAQATCQEWMCYPLPR